MKSDILTAEEVEKLRSGMASGYSLDAMSASHEVLRQQVATLTEERDQARSFGERAAEAYNRADVACAFCGAKYPLGTPRHGDGALTEHVRVCPEHPMRAVEAERDALREERDKAIAERDRWCDRLAERGRAIERELAEARAEIAAMNTRGDRPKVTAERDALREERDKAVRQAQNLYLNTSEELAEKSRELAEARAEIAKWERWANMKLNSKGRMVHLLASAEPCAEGPTDYDTLLTSWAELRQEATRLRALLDGKGTWPNGTHRAFVEGAAWGFWKARGATFFRSERDEAENEAIARYGPVPTPPRDPAGKE